MIVAPLAKNESLVAEIEPLQMLKKEREYNKQE